MHRNGKDSAGLEVVKGDQRRVADPSEHVCLQGLESDAPVEDGQEVEQLFGQYGCPSSTTLVVEG